MVLKYTGSIGSYMCLKLYVLQPYTIGGHLVHSSKTITYEPLGEHLISMMSSALIKRTKNQIWFFSHN